MYTEVFAVPFPESDAQVPLTLAAFDPIDIDNGLTTRKMAGRQ